MAFLYEYGMFLAKIVTVTSAVIVVIGIIARLAQREQGPKEGKIKVRKLNRVYERMERTLRQKIMNETEWKQYAKEQKKADKQKEKEEPPEERRPRTFVLEFEGDLNATAVKSLREEISAVLTVAEKDDEVLLKLQSPGGAVHSYGLAASQLERLREGEVTLTVSVDKIAASGGYKMACVADTILAAPFAVIGSIGVVSEMPNFNRFLKSKNVDYEQLTAGEHKRTLTLFGKNSPAARKKHEEQLQEIHELFKQFVSEHRTEVDIARVSTGEYWYGKQALELNLIDEIGTSDDWLMARRESNDIFSVKFSEPDTLATKIQSNLSRLGKKMFLDAWTETEQLKYN